MRISDTETPQNGNRSVTYLNNRLADLHRYHDFAQAEPPPVPKHKVVYLIHPGSMLLVCFKPALRAEDIDVLAENPVPLDAPEGDTDPGASWNEAAFDRFTFIVDFFDVQAGKGRPDSHTLPNAGV